MPNKISMGTFNIPAPNTCPLCHHKVYIDYHITAFSPDRMNLHVVYQCPAYECRNFFIAYYHREDETFVLVRLNPTKLIIPAFSDFINKISPNFVAIYQEAEEAKQNNLSQIAGPGYRKAFEFLIKDYAKSRTPEEKHKDIESKFANNVIKEFIGDVRIRKVASRALWLGNDETHYLRKWEDKDISDLITLINLTIHSIEIEQQSAEYVAEMPE